MLKHTRTHTNTQTHTRMHTDTQANTHAGVIVILNAVEFVVTRKQMINVLKYNCSSKNF